MPDTYNSLTALFTAVADAIRARAGTAAAIPAQGFPAAIAAIPAGGTDTSDATAAAGDILSGKTAYVNGAKLTGTVPSLAAATVTPGAAAQTIAAGQYLAGAQTVAGDANLAAGNIKSGVSIFGVAGSLVSPAVPPSAVNTHRGYVSGNHWYYGESADYASDVFPAISGHKYVIGLGATVGSRFRTLFVKTDPAVATSDIAGWIIDSDSTVAAYGIRGVYTPGADGYIVVFKGNDGSGDAVVSYVLDLTVLG